MDRKELQNLIQGVVVTTPTPMDEDYNIDLGRTAEITRWWVDEGLGTNTAPLKVCAAGGEGPDLTDDEWEGVIRTTIDAAGPDAVVTCALKPKNTFAHYRGRQEGPGPGHRRAADRPAFLPPPDPGRLRAVLRRHIRRH